MTSGIYLITCRQNERRYVGSSSVIEARFYEHLAKALRQSHHSRLFQEDFNRFGADAFSYVVLEEVATRSDLKIREQHYIDTLHPEYNMSPFANRPTRQGKPVSDSARAKASESNKRVWRKLSEEERKKRAVNSTRHFQSEDVKARSKEGFARWTEEQRPKRAEQREQKRAEWEAGREQREQERREKLRAANTGKRQSKETKAKLRAVALEQQADPEYRAKHQQAVNEAMQRPEVKEKHRQGIAARPPMTEEHRAKIGTAHRGMKRPPETGEKIAASKRGKKRSPETIEKLKAAWVRRKARKQE